MLDRFHVSKGPKITRFFLVVQRFWWEDATMQPTSTHHFCSENMEFICLPGCIAQPPAALMVMIGSDLQVWLKNFTQRLPDATEAEVQG